MQEGSRPSNDAGSWAGTCGGAVASGSVKCLEGQGQIAKRRVAVAVCLADRPLVVNARTDERTSELRSYLPEFSHLSG
jgi:hypothetical protein